jgi:hypothetical protein
VLGEIAYESAGEVEVIAEDDSRDGGSGSSAVRAPTSAAG